MARHAICLILVAALAWAAPPAVAAGGRRAVVRLGGGRRALQQQQQVTWSGFPPPNHAAAAAAAAIATATASNNPLAQQAAYANAAAATAAPQQGTAAGAIAVVTPLFAQQQAAAPVSTYQPDMQQPDMQQLAMQQPAMQQPDMQQPDMQQPAMQQPDMQQYGGSQSGGPHAVSIPMQIQQGQQWTGASANGASSGGSGTDMPAILDLHNSLRAKHMASPLSWSPELAAAAQAWADRCVFQHSGGGENLAQYFSDPISAVQAWYDEIRMYDYASASYSSATGHATQLLWRDSTQLGCGWAAGCQLLVCRYSPPGNVLGQFAQNVMPPSA